MNLGIITAASGYELAQIKPWIDSLIRTGYTGKIAVMLYDQKDEIAEYLYKKGVRVFYGEKRPLTHIATQRFQDYTWLLKDEYFADVTHVLHTDIRDVLFQSNPVDVMSQWQNENLVATAEGICFRHEDWNGEGIEENFGKNAFMKLADEQVLCSGIIGGKIDWFVRLCNTIFDLAFYSNSPDNFADQHFYNYAIYCIYRKWTKIVSADQPWVANLATLIALPMHSPNWSTGPRTANRSYERFRSGTFVENLTVNMPMLIDGQVVNHQNCPYAIVHQYDRYPEWSDKLLEKNC